ncbi:polymeric immunoglobulin receptor-like [Chanos chanos]|uniref:polymeric immunoglobulin receptor-like n=1 Tax=Chanos chanos TaxID=29144 RepID=UPI0011F1E1A1|nr:polymeric immunoglobulin receptor-like [Chanos chanos]
MISDTLMALFYTALLLFIRGISNVESVKTLDKVQANAGETLTIPCFYEHKYKDHVKYWCKGSNWDYCTTLARTGSPEISQVIIRDYPFQNVFTVTMKNLRGVDSNKYWCAVEISGGGDDGAWVSLSVNDAQVSITDHPSQQVFMVTMKNIQEYDTDVYWCAVQINGGGDDGEFTSLVFINALVGIMVEDNSISGEEGSHVTVQCFYSERLTESDKNFCRADSWTSCLSPKRVSQPYPALIQISDDNTGMFNVTMNNLKKDDAGLYWCTAGEERFPVYINVSEKRRIPKFNKSDGQLVGGPPDWQGDLPSSPCWGWSELTKAHWKFPVSRHEV